MGTLRRPYRSGLRAQQAGQTTDAILEGARRLFVANGYAATGMREIAAVACVAVETVYSRFSSKRSLLAAVIDAAAAGDDGPTAVASRPEFLAMGEGSRRVRLGRAAGYLGSIYSRSIDLIKVLRDAAATDSALKQLWDGLRESQRSDVAAAFELLIGRAPTVREADGLWAIVNPEVYLLLVHECGWAPEEYEAWIVTTTERVLPRS